MPNAFSWGRLKGVLRTLLPAPALNTARRARRAAGQWLLGASVRTLDPAQVERVLNQHGFNVSLTSDAYSPLPLVSQLEDHFSRWTGPSALVGVQYDLEAMKARLRRLAAAYLSEYQELPAYEDSQTSQYGPGFTIMDAMLLYFIIREIKPRRYIEIGSGLSTYYCSLARRRNAAEGAPFSMTCIDPTPFENLRRIPEVTVLRKEAQDVDVAFFEDLSAGDVLFIDTTHVVKLDGEVPYMFLEVIPRLKVGVTVHAHDIHYPFNTPYPPEFYVTGRAWGRPMFWTEPMLVQAFLAFNSAFRVTMSMPMLRFFCEDDLRSILPNYTPLQQSKPNTHFGSLWFERFQ